MNRGAVDLAERSELYRKAGVVFFRPQCAILYRRPGPLRTRSARPMSGTVRNEMTETTYVIAPTALKRTCRNE